MEHCVYQTFITCGLLQPKQSWILACYRTASESSVMSQSESGRLFESLGAQVAKLWGLKYLVLIARTCRLPWAAECKWQRPALAVTRTQRSWSLGGIADKSVEFVDDSLWPWQPVEIISKCWCDVTTSTCVPVILFLLSAYYNWIWLLNNY